MGILKRTIRGIRDSLPSGYMLGRLSSGDGPAELISLDHVAQKIAATGIVGGSGGGSVADFGLFFSGKPGSSQVIFEMIMSKNILLPLHLGGSQFKPNTPPLADYTVTLNKNGVSIGTIKFAATTGATTIVFTASKNFSIGDTFQIVGPVTADGNIADIAFSFSASFI